MPKKLTPQMKRFNRRIYIAQVEKQKFRDMVAQTRRKLIDKKIEAVRRRESLLFLLIHQEQAGDKTLKSKIDSLTEEVSYTNATA